ncbi:MAG: bacterial Ig-like domain-containing protein [Bacteroidales bacterium]|nr:bacterial Ig-like domain-containing protein [Candidatus Colicola equi]
MKNVKTNQMNACRCNSEGAGAKMTSWLNNNFRLLALTLLAMLSSSVWGADTWTKLTTVPAVGDVVIFVNESAKREMTGISSYGIATTYTTSPAGTYPLTVCAGSSNGKLAFKTSDNKYLYWNSGNSLGVNETLDNKTSWTVSVSSGNFTITNVNESARKLQYNKSSGSERFACYTSSQQLIQIYKKASSKTLSSITVKTAPSKVTYTEGDKFDPTGLVITKTYSDGSTEDLAYAGHTSDFTFNPTTSAALTTSNTSVTITVGGKSTTQSITVNAKSKYTVTFYNAGEVVKTVSDVTEGTLFSAIKPTIGTGSGQLNIESCDNSSTHFMGWTTDEAFQKRETKPSYVADNDAINDNMTVRAVWAAEEQ